NPYCVAFSPSGRYLAAANGDSSIRLWNLFTGKEDRRLSGHQGGVLSLAFARNGKQLYSGSMDGTVLVWDLKALGQGQSKSGDFAQKEARWGDLASKDSARAYSAMRVLLASPGQTVALLKDKVKPAVAADPQRVSALIADLNSPQFAVRQKASEELAKMGESAA